MSVDPSGFEYGEYYLYSEKAYELASIGVDSHTLASGVYQNAPIIVTSSGYETTRVEDTWGRVDGEGKYTKVGYGYFTTLSDGTYDTSCKEFALHPDSSGEIIFNQTLSEHVFIEYESGPSGYYILDDLDLNPVRGQTGGGFLGYSSVTDPESLYLMTTQSTLRADGFQHAKIIATLFDSDFDRISGKAIIFELQNVNVYSNLGELAPIGGSITRLGGSGLPIEIIETTNTRGEATAKFITKDNAGTQDIKAYYQDASGIYDVVRIALINLAEDPFTLDLSFLDSLDYLI